MSTKSDDHKVPSEYRISEEWDKCLENFALRFSAGLVAGGLSSVVMARTGTMRGVVTGFGAGAGAGSSWTVCAMAFRGDNRAQDALDKGEKKIEAIKERLHKHDPRK